MAGFKYGDFTYSENLIVNLGKEREMKTINAVEILHGRYIKGDKKRLGSLKIERFKSKVAQSWYNFKRSK